MLTTVSGLNQRKKSIRLLIYSPHVLSFSVFNALYYFPLLFVLFYGYEEGGVNGIIENEYQQIGKVTLTYIIGVGSFILGSFFCESVNNSVKIKRIPSLPTFTHILTLRFYLFCLVIFVLFLSTKILLAKEGIYGEYAFDTGMMSGGLWTFSMFLSEVLVFLSIIVLTSSPKQSSPLNITDTSNKNIKLFFFLSLTCSINMLHGTRIFTNILLIIGISFAFLKSKKIIKTLILSVSITLIMFIIFYIVFLIRSNVSDIGEYFTFQRLFGPIIYESVFSQISLMKVSMMDYQSLSNLSRNYFYDVIINVFPRFLLPDKDVISSTEAWSSLSPLGAMSGYAAGYLYFGYFFWLFYFSLGFLGSFLFLQAKSNRGISYIIYYYYFADFLYRIMRDGYIIPTKMLVNTIIIAGFLYFTRSILILRKKEVDSV